MGPTAPTLGSQRLDSLTSLRWFAAFAVWATHFGHLFEVSVPAIARGVTAGQAGVSFFFLLSGFILTSTRRADDPAARFLRRRLARIYPNHLVVLVLVAVIFFFADRAQQPGPFVAQLTLTQAWIPSARYFGSYTYVTWSLSCELFFYLLFPLAYVVVAKLAEAPRRALLAFAVA